MHLYWRMIEELKYLGELWEITDPAILRGYQLWKQRHSHSLSIADIKVKRIELPVLCDYSNSIH
jgi:hypothetical protein